MISKLILKNFKKVKEQTFEFNAFNLIVGGNNSGKSTILQALAIWQYCVNQFTFHSARKGGSGIGIVLPNFTALPLPEFNLLWTGRNTQEKDSKKILIEIDVYWLNAEGKESNFCIELRYQSEQQIYAIPSKGWEEFNQLKDHLPVIVYVPPFSSLEAKEDWVPEGKIDQRVGQALPGLVLRNVLYRVAYEEDTSLSDNANKKWKELTKQIKDWFDIDLILPKKEINVTITANYKDNKKQYDIISGGSGFHQILTCLGFLYGYKNVTTILFDEPDAHLHVNLQRKIIQYFKHQPKVQFLITSHSEEFIKNVEIDSIISMTSGKPSRIKEKAPILKALSGVDNIDIVRIKLSPYILYIEGEDDERILSAWADTLNKTELYQKFYPYFLRGDKKEIMKKKADDHFKALRQIEPDVQQMLLLDYDKPETALNPTSNNIHLNEWKRKNIDNYLLVPEAWKRAIEKDEFGTGVFRNQYHLIIDNFFGKQNLTLPLDSSWRSVDADVFESVNGKKLLFEDPKSLFALLQNQGIKSQSINKSAIAASMKIEEIHRDIVDFFSNMEKIIQLK